MPIKLRLFNFDNNIEKPEKNHVYLGFNEDYTLQYMDSNGIISNVIKTNNEQEYENLLIQGYLTVGSRDSSGAYGSHSVTLGTANIASSEAALAQGKNASATGIYSLASGEFVRAAGKSAFVKGAGTSTTDRVFADGELSFVFQDVNGGVDSTSKYGVILGGYSNNITASTLASIYSSNSSVISGTSTGSSIFASSASSITNAANVVILGGGSNKITYTAVTPSVYSVLLGGLSNTISLGTFHNIIGGTNNRISGGYNNAIIGGTSNSITNASTSDVIMIGLNGVTVSDTLSDYIYVPRVRFYMDSSMSVNIPEGTMFYNIENDDIEVLLRRGGSSVSAFSITGRLKADINAANVASTGNAATFRTNISVYAKVESVQAGVFADLAGNFNNMTTNSYIGSINATTNQPTGTSTATWYNVISTRHRNGVSDGNNYGLQLASQLNSHRLHMREQYAGSWSNWYEIYTSYNLDPAIYAVKANNERITGQYTFAHSSGESFKLNGSSTGNANLCYIPFYESNGTVRQGYIGFGSTSNSDLYLMNDLSAGNSIIIKGDGQTIDFGSTSKTNATVVNILSGNGFTANLNIYSSDGATYGNGNGNGLLFIGQDGSYGGGLGYRGDSNGASLSTFGVDSISFYRRNAGADSVIFYTPYNENNIYFSAAGIFNSTATFNGNILCSKGQTTPEVSGSARGHLYTYEVYNAYDASYGVAPTDTYNSVLGFGGIGRGEIAIGWYGNNGIYYRSKRNSSSTWNSWSKLATEALVMSTVNNYMKLVNTGATDSFVWSFSDMSTDYARMSLTIGDGDNEAFVIKNPALTFAVFKGNGVTELFNLNVTDSLSVSNSLTARTLSLTTSLPITSGGTGASTAANARTNLDVYSKSEGLTAVGLQIIYAAYVSHTSSSSYSAFALRNYGSYTITFTKVTSIDTYGYYRVSHNFNKGTSYYVLFESNTIYNQGSVGDANQTGKYQVQVKTATYFDIRVEDDDSTNDSEFSFFVFVLP